MVKILIVDDAMFMRQVIAGALKEGGYDDILGAEDGAVALKLFEEERPELTILDITMPGMDGIETLRRIKALDKEAKVIICSAIGQEKQILRAIDAGAADYIVKPFKAEDMLRVIGKVINQG